MVKKSGIFIGLGLVWLFLFSLPVGKGKNLFELLTFYVVDTRPVHWVVGQVQSTYDSTLEATEKGTSVPLKDKFAQSENVLSAIE
jgi:hypothetical protein